MAANPITDFDLGPLTWVKTEIDHSLAQARESLDKLSANPADRAPVKYILTHLHQATGALAMVGLGAATRFNEELEKLVAFLETEEESRVPEAVPVAKKAIGVLSSYLDTLLAGQPDQPMRLVGAYVALGRARGTNEAAESDLFYPNLSAPLPAVPGGPALDDAVLAKALQHQRAQYQQGLLKMLKGGADNAEALRQMHGAVCAIESLQLATPNRAFWTAVSAFFDALVFGGLEINAGTKPLFAKVDQQVKHLIEGTGKVAERLFRDVLLQVGRARPMSERITLLKEVYHLEQLLAVPEAVSGAQDETLGTTVREIRELTAQQKDTWLKYTSGNRAAIEVFAKQATVLVERASGLPNADIQAVFARLNEVVPALKRKAIPPSEAQSLEVATALLFIEAALENYLSLGADFSRQAQTVAQRLRGALAGETLAPVDSIAGGLLDEMTRRAQEKLLVFQVGQEVQVNLQNIEQVLDGFFRDSAKRTELAALLGQFAQVQGALMIMELMDAASLNAAVMGRVQEFSEGSADGTGDAADLVADGLSALGLYMTALQQGAASPRDVLLPALRRFGLADAEPAAEIEVRRTGTVSPQDIEIQKQKVQALYEDWKDEPAVESREKLERAVDDLKRDASVASDSLSARQSEQALQAIKDADTPDATGVFQAIEALAPEKPPETPTAHVVQLVDAPGAEIDRELLEIFLEEAGEVVETIASNVAVCRDARDDREALTTIRRGFHTLKGSGRMVGLTALGELAWQCEQVMNKWLKDEKPASTTLVEFIDLAGGAFGEWVTLLKENPAAGIECAEIVRRAELLKSDQGEETLASEGATPAAQAEFEEISLEAAPVAADAAPVQPEEPVLDEAPFTLEEAAPLEDQPAPVQAAELPAFDFESLDLTPASEPAAEVAAAQGGQPASLEFDSFVEPPTPPAEPSDVAVGDVAIPAALFQIYIGEAEEHAASMEREMSALEADPLMPVSPAFMRAAHTLASSSRTTGFASVADVSSTLEKWLSEAIEFPPEMNMHRLAVTRDAVDALNAMVQSIRGNAMPYPREDVVVAVNGLRDELRAARETGEGTHVKMPGILRAALEAAHEIEVPAARLDEPAASAPAPSEPEVIETAALEPTQLDAPMLEPTAFETRDAQPTLVEPEAVEPAAIMEPVAAEVIRMDAAPQPAFDALPMSQPEPTGEGDKPFESGKDQRKIKDDVDRDLLPVFLEEAKELVPLVSEGVRRWKAAPTDHSHVPELQRHLHTLKGSARMTGLMRLGELAHVIETRLNAIDEMESPPAKEFEEIEERVDRFSVSLERLARGEDIVEAEPVQVPESAVFEHQKDKPRALAVIAAAAEERAQRDAAPPEMREQRQALLRVNAEMIDRFVNEAGELSIARSRIEGEMTAFKRAMGDLTDNIARMRAQLREIEIAAEGQMQSTIKLKEESGEQFDPLEFDRFSRMQELTRFLAESLGDVITLHQGLQKNIDETELAIHAQARLNRELQQGLMGVRLVPLGNLSDRFYRIVRQTAKEIDKKANLELKGTRTELDRSVLEKITAPFEHLLRNAIAHGIEMPAERVKAGKDEIGEISIDAVQRGNEVVLTISDDGGGLNFARIRDKAVEAGLLAPDVELPEAQLAQFIFMPGFSTAKEVTEISGRGVGMDVVKNEITSLGGRIEIASTPGRGTIFTITLPLTLAVTQAVMMRAGATIYAVPSVMIEQVFEFKAEPYAELLAKGEVDWKGNKYLLRSLLPLLGEIDTPTPARQIPVLLLKSGFQRAAIRVDEIIGNREIVVKTIGPQLSRLSGIAGATVLGNGQVVLILNPVQLVHRERPAFDRIEAPATPQEPAFMVEEKSGNPLVMVVDDSLTVRKITSRMLAREGFEVATAKDGVDALQQLQELKPDCILLDVEMPRMDGFEFARNVRADDHTKRIPIIMITSRTADKHRNHALEIGVNEYMGKPYQEDQLLELIRRYTSEGVIA